MSAYLISPFMQITHVYEISLHFLDHLPSDQAAPVIVAVHGVMSKTSL